MPSLAELKRAEEAFPGGGKELLQSHLDARTSHERRLDLKLELEVKEQRNVQTYRLASVVCGSFLGFSSLVVCGYGLSIGANLLPLATVLGPVAGIAGVFVWGYRPAIRSTTSTASTAAQERRSQLPP